MRRYGLAADTIRLSVFSFLMRAVGLLYSVWLTNAVGIRTLGLTQLVSVAYGFCATLSCAGLRLAATQLSTRAIAHKKSPVSVLRFCVCFGFLWGCTVAAGLFFLSPQIAASLLNEANLAPALRCVSLALPFLAMTSALYGYYTAKGRILLLSFLQGLEQLFQITIVFLLLSRQVRPGSFQTAFALMVSVVAAEAFSFGLACLFLPKNFSKEKENTEPPSAAAFFRIVLPSGVSSVACSLLRSAQEVLIPTALVAWGLTRVDAVSLYGTVNGVVYPVLFFPAAILTSLSIVIVPALTRAYVCGNRRRILSLTRRLLRLTISFSLGCCVFLFSFSDAISLCLFSDASYGSALVLFSPLIPLAYLDLIVDSILRSIDKQIWATVCAVADAGLSLLLIQILVPAFGVAGLAASVLSAKLLNLSLSLLRLESGLSVGLKPVRFIFLPFLFALLCARACSVIPAGAFPATAVLLVKGFCFCASYCACLLLVRPGEDREEDAKNKRLQNGRYRAEHNKNKTKKTILFYGDRL